MIEFWLNDQHIRTALPAGLPLLDFIRYERDRPAPRWAAGKEIAAHASYWKDASQPAPCTTTVSYPASRPWLRRTGATSSPSKDWAPPPLTPVQKALVDHSAIQCGFCTPGIAMALTALCLSDEYLTEDRALAALDGNLCRCTGYQSLKRTVRELLLILPIRPEDRPISWLIAHGFLPAYFSEMTERLTRIAAPSFPKKKRPWWQAVPTFTCSAPTPCFSRVSHFSKTPPKGPGSG
ncbi:MAG: hypothetical protein IPJ40_24255 [Saprospirales bacterium]|nr:hypothetical protein [Saprospirales bacterium]